MFKTTEYSRPIDVGPSLYTLITQAVDTQRHLHSVAEP